MRLLALTAIFSCCAMTGLGAQPPTADVAGTWSGPAECRHGGGETLTLTIERAPDGTLRGSTDWARSTSDGRRGRPVPFTTLVVEDGSIRATTTAQGRTARLAATLDGDILTGGWAIDGDDDKWTFTARRQPPESAERPPR